MNKLEIRAAIQKYFRAKQYAYQQVFNPRNVYLEKVLKDLARFCRAHESTFHVDARAHAILEGRREVFLRIEKFMKLTPEQIWELYGKEEIQ